MQCVLKNAKLFARKRDEKLVAAWQRQNPKNAPLPPGYGVVSINGELVAALLYKEKDWSFLYD